jgi:hypothetical protein
VVVARNESGRRFDLSAPGIGCFGKCGFRRRRERCHRFRFNLVIEAVKTEDDRGVMFLLIPPQPEVLQPFLVKGTVQEGRVLGNHFSLVRRRDDETASVSAEVVHGWMVAGRAVFASQNRSPND